MNCDNGPSFLWYASFFLLGIHACFCFLFLFCLFCPFVPSLLFFQHYFSSSESSESWISMPHAFLSCTFQFLPMAWSLPMISCCSILPHAQLQVLVNLLLGQLGTGNEVDLNEGTATISTPAGNSSTGASDRAGYWWYDPLKMFIKMLPFTIFDEFLNHTDQLMWYHILVTTNFAT